MDGLKATLSFDAFAYDYDDEYLTIDTDTHTININNVSRLFGVQYDGNSKLIKFRIRNKLSDIQKMQDSIVYINWIDSRGVKGQSIAINKTINNDTCEFAWKVPFDALKNSGVLHFAMSAVMTKNSSSVIDQRWSTQIASVITPDGIYIKSYTPSSEEEDRIAQIYNELSNMINKQTDNLQAQVNSLKDDLGNLVNGTQEVITIPDTIGHVTNYSGYSQEIAKVKVGEKWIVLFDTFSNGVSIRNLIDSWNGISSPMNAKNICELQIPVDGSLRLNVEDTTYSGTYYAYNVTNKATLNDYLEKNGINGLYKIYTEKNEKYIKQYVDSIDPLTNSELFSNQNIASDGALDFRRYNDSLAPYTSSINIGTDYIFVAELEVENKSGFEIYSMYLSEGLVIRNQDGGVISYAPVLNFDGKYATGNSVTFQNVNLKNNTKKAFKVLGRINTNSFTTNKIYWTLGFNRFRKKNSEVNITTGISGICKNVWLFADNQDSDQTILDLVGRNILDDNILVKHCINADMANKINNIFNGKKLTTYGDSITANGGWQSYLKDYFGFIIENKGIGGTTVADNGNGDSFCIQNRIDTISPDSDVVIVMGGTNDCGQSIEIGDLTYSNGFDTTKFKGGLATTIRMIQSRCPNALILVASLCGGRGNEAGENLDTPVYNTKNLTSHDYAKATKDVAEFFNIQYVPIFEECGINCWNRATYIADTVHPNDFGKKQLAKIFIKYLASYLIS